MALLSVPRCAQGADVVSVTPATNAQQVAAASNITVVFDAVIASGNVSTATFRAWGSQTGMFTGSFTGGGTNTITFDPARNFKAGETITITLTTGLGLTTAYTWCFTVASAAVTPQFVPRTPIANSLIVPYAAYAADIDGDGDLDVLSASNGDDKIAWYENDGSETFTAHTITTAADGATSVSAADLDADGDLDVLSTSYSDNKVAWYENDGAQNFTPRVVAIAAGPPGRVSAADLDGDADLDVLVASTPLTWYENNGSASFTPHAFTTNGAYFVSAADIDSDGDLDILSMWTGKIVWYKNDGLAGFTEQMIVATTADAGSATDIDGDGDMDVVASNGSSIRWYKNNGSQSFTSNLILNSADLLYDVHTADMDGDGDRDVLVGKAGLVSIARMENVGSGFFSNQVLATSSSALGVFSVYAADLDSDGDLDALSASFADGRIAWFCNNMPPVVSGTLAGQLVHANATVAPFAALTLSDSDAGQILSITVQLDVAAKGSFTPASLAATGFTGSAASNYSFIGTASDAQAALRSLVFAPAAGRLALGASETVDFTIFANDNVSPVTTDNITSVVVTQVNNAPSFTKGADVTVNEDVTAQSIAAWATNLSVGPAHEAGQLLSFQVTNDNNTLFSAQPAIDASGTLTFTPAANAAGTATVTVALQDDGGTANGGEDESAAITFTITLNAVNDVPSFTKGADVVVNEDVATQSVAGWATGISKGPANESGQSLSFQVSNDDNTLFSAQPAIDASGTLTFTPAANAWGATTVTVSLKDDGGTANSGVDESAAVTFTITLNAVNDVPSFTKGADVAVNEDAAAQSLVTWATGISKGAANESGQSLSFQVSNDNNTLFSAQPAIDASGTLTFTPAVNAWGAAIVTVSLRDDGGTANSGVDESAAVTFTITLNAVNDVPAFTKGADVGVNEDAIAQSIAGWATSLSAGPANESAQGLSFNVSNDNNTLFSVQPAIDASGTLTFTPAADAWGSATVTVAIADNGGTANGGVNQSAATTFTVTLNAVNDLPSFTKGADVVVNEDAAAQNLVSWAANISKGPANESGQALSFQVSNDNNALFSVQPTISTAGTLTFTPAPDAWGEATITVVLQDDGGTANGGVDKSAATTFRLSVMASNRAPGFTKGADVAVNEDAVAQNLAGWATNISAGLPHESGQALSFNVSNDNNALFSVQPAISASGTLTFTPAPNKWGVAIVTVVLKDDGGTANGGIDQSAPVTFNITLNAVNDAPHMDPVGDVAVAVNSQPLTITLTGLDPGPGETSQQLTVTAFSDTHSLLADPTVTLSGNGTATLQLAPIQGMIDMATITVVIRDNGGTASSGMDETLITFTVTVSDAIQPAFVPTLFSPNGDGANDVFRVRASGIADIRFSIYSTDGNEVFTTTDITTATEDGWNGRYQGRDMPAGSYTWTLQGHYLDGTTLTAGNKSHGQVVLLR
ncbi:VCBS repeat-containing protein [Fulvivirgaceae bacterium PWU4]|uniref:VCBS repeat-containing protein n=1 Tax=Chryseosolibacter histidini TaxID=2782349 RepID=A0AAP2DUF7_9BACT|nr:FG-GAP-like repeat-containing protein [Chryseosolibacter histidini]MBT1701533.1 VCBS repeat-containing protein [Chryseosolibacter histidini]